MKISHFLSLHPLRSGVDLLFFAESTRRRILFLLSLKNPARIFSKYLQYGYWPCGI